jgi:putative tricarboxylic transport membrane protein
MMISFALGAVGLDQMTGQLRLTFGFPHLLSGFDFLIAVIGLFGIGEILLTLEEGLAFRGGSAKINLRVVLQTWKELPAYWVTSLRSCVIGCWMGITPAGATPASFMSYGIAKRVSKNGKNFGKGEIEGVVAPETAAHAAGTSALPARAAGRSGAPHLHLEIRVNGQRRCPQHLLRGLFETGHTTAPEGLPTTGCTF